MSAQIIDTSDHLLTLRVTGLLKHCEFAAAQREVADWIRKQGQVRVLVLMEDFAGLEKEGDWGDISFAARNDPFIEKIAIVGDSQWEDLTLLFTGKGVRRVPIEYFATSDLPKAQAWLKTVL